MSDYEVDEYYEDDPEPEGYSVWEYVHKAQNGHVAFHKVTLLRWKGQDWGECDTYNDFYNLNDMSSLVKANCVALARNMPPGASCDWQWLHISDWIMYLKEPLPRDWQNEHWDYVDEWGEW